MHLSRQMWSFRFVVAGSYHLENMHIIVSRYLALLDLLKCALNMFNGHFSQQIFYSLYKLIKH